MASQSVSEFLADTLILALDTQSPHVQIVIFVEKRKFMAHIVTTTVESGPRPGIITEARTLGGLR
jgi:hypothetical protein